MSGPAIPGQRSSSYPTGRPVCQYKAVLFDLDGVLTPTSNLHRQAWQSLFDQVLPDRVEAYGDQDYYQYVEDRPHHESVKAVLSSRGLQWPWGEPADLMEDHTICGLGNGKDEIFNILLENQGMEPYRDAVTVLRHLLAARTKMAVVSYSCNAREVLSAAKILPYFDAVIDGGTIQDLNLSGKPQPDIYLYAARLMGQHPSDCVIIEDAVSGVTAGKAGRFGLTIGLDRGAGARRLREAGADMVINELAEILQMNSLSTVNKNRMAQGIDPLDLAHYPISPWTFTELGPPTEESASLFTVSNGYLGIRADGPGPRDLESGTFLSGFHETFPIHHAEDAFGYARVGQVIQGVPDRSGFRCSVDGVELDDPVTSLTAMDMKAGYSTRTMRFTLDTGSIEIEIRRMACLFKEDLTCCTLTLTAHGSEMLVHVDGKTDMSDPIRTGSEDPRKGHQIGDNRMEPITIQAPDHENGRVDTAAETDTPFADIQAWLEKGDQGVYRCANSHMVMAMASAQSVEMNPVDDELDILVTPDHPVQLIRYTSYRAPRVNPEGTNQGLAVSTIDQQDPVALLSQCRQTLSWAVETGLERLLDMQKHWLDTYWKHADIIIETESDQGGRIEQIVHWELFQLAQASAFVPNGIGAKGLTGSGYSGHYFWDTEIFIMPFLTYVMPEAARSVLDYRYRMLPAAKIRAASLDLPGALFPWRTIDGEEASAFFPAGTAQYHINADIAYALCQYAAASNDFNFLAQQGAEILIETARLWMELGHFASDGGFHINAVTGPDEYSAMVNDNYYTNAMARFNLLAAVKAVEYLRNRKERNDGAENALDRLGLVDSEIMSWTRAADSMALPTDSEENIELQDTDFMKLKAWDFTHKAIHPLLLHYHPLSIYRHRVIKQADLVLALYLLSANFSDEQKQADFNYYDPLTTGDSTLSSSTQSIIAAEIGQEDLAMRYFLETLYTDVANLHANTRDGLHLACAGGLWQALVSGFGGLRDNGGARLSIDPHLPSEWKSLEYQIRVKGGTLRIRVTHEDITATRLEGQPMTILIQGHEVRIDNSVHFGTGKRAGVGRRLA